MNKAFLVVADCVDIRSGKRFQVGQEFDPPPSPAQAKRLVAAGCLPEEAIDAAKTADADLAAVSRDQINNDGLFDLSDELLAEVVSTEGIELDPGSDKAATIAAIRAARAGSEQNDPLPEASEMRTEEGERAARETDARARDRQSAAQAAEGRAVKRKAAK